MIKLKYNQSKYKNIGMKGIDIDKAKDEIKGERLEFETDRVKLEEDYHVKIFILLYFILKKLENCRGKYKKIKRSEKRST